MNKLIWKYLGLICRQFLSQPKGRLQLVALRHEPQRSMKEKWYSPRDELRGLVEWAEEMNTKQYNIYACWALFRREERKLEHAIATSAFVADWDGQDPEEIDGFDPSLVVETSPGHYQEVFIHEPIGVEEAGRRYKALARRLGCDIGPSGDPVHLWRVPGTMNWPKPSKKRKPSPSKWDGHTGSRIQLPDIGERVDDRVGGEWPEHHTGKPLTSWLKAALKKDWEPGERSEQFHKIVLGIAKLGWGMAEIEEFLRRNRSLSEKYGRRLRAEIERSIGKSELEPPEDLGDLEIKWFNPKDVERTITFLWFPYLPRGEVTLLDGDGGIGKTSLMLRVAQAVIEGDDMPNGERIKGGSKVLYVSLEADYSGVTLPILKRLGMTKDGYFAHVEDPSFQIDEEGLDRLVRLQETHKFDFIVIDSLVDFLPDELEMNDYKQSSKLVLQLRARIAQPFNTTIVCLRHNTKGSKDKLGYRGMGSMGWAKGSRSQLVVREDTEIDQQYVVAHTKHNLSPKGDSLVYQFREVASRGIVEWIGVSDVEDEELNAPKNAADRKSKLKECSDWLAELIRGKGAVSTVWIFEQGETRSFNRRLIQRAAEELSVERSAAGAGGSKRGATWSLPNLPTGNRKNT